MVAELGHPVPGVQTRDGGAGPRRRRRADSGPSACPGWRRLCPAPGWLQDLRRSPRSFAARRTAPASVPESPPSARAAGIRSSGGPPPAAPAGASAACRRCPASRPPMPPVMLSTRLAQPPKAQHLGMTAGGIAAGAAHVHLRLVGGMLRHQQDLLGCSPQAPPSAAAWYPIFPFWHGRSRSSA